MTTPGRDLEPFPLRMLDGEQEPRVLDADLGTALGMAKPTNIRGVIEKNRAELERFGPLHAVNAMVEIGSGAKRTFTVYYLNEEQSLLSAALSKAPKAADVRAGLVQAYVAFRRGRVGAGLSPDLAEEIHRIFGVTKMLAHKVTATEADVAELKAAKAAPTFDLSDTVTADQIITMAGITKAERQRGTTRMITCRMQEFCGERDIAIKRTPEDLNPSRPYRFPRQVAHEWLFGDALGAELIRTQISERIGAKKAGHGQIILPFAKPR